MNRSLNNQADCSTLASGATFPTSLLNPSFNQPLSGEAVQSQSEFVNWRVAAAVADEKKASDIRVLDLRPVTTFTDYFVICTVSNPRQGQAICDEVETQLKEYGERPVSVEGYDSAEWILMDYGDFLLHIFSATARSYYDLERLWRHAETIGSK